MFGIGQSETNALKVLEQDHDAVDALFKQYESDKDDMKPAQKQKLATQICEMLTVHATIEEEIFYPAVRNLDEEVRDLVSEAAVEHQSLKDIIGRLEAAPPSDPLYDAGVKVLSEYVKHHVKEEESELFPKVRSSDLDLDTVGQQLLDRKAELESGGQASKSRRGNARKSQEDSAAVRSSRARSLASCAVANGAGSFFGSATQMAATVAAVASGTAQPRCQRRQSDCVTGGGGVVLIKDAINARHRAHPAT